MKRGLPYLLTDSVIPSLGFFSPTRRICPSESFILCGESYALAFKRFATNLPLTRLGVIESSARIFQKKSPTQHLTYRPPPPGRCQWATRRQREGRGEGGGGRPSDKKVRNGQRWMDFQHYIMKTYLLFSIHVPHALTHCSLHTLSSPWRYLSHPLLLSHKAFGTEPCRCSVSHRRPSHILSFQRTSLIIILGVIE